MESDKEETRDPLVYAVVGLSVDNIAGQETAGRLRMAWAGPGGEALQGGGGGGGPRKPLWSASD